MIKEKLFNGLYMPELTVHEVSETIKKSRKEIKLSELYASLLEGKLTSEQKWILLKTVKSIATTSSRLDLLIFSEKSFLDLAKPETSTDF